MSLYLERVRRLSKSALKINQITTGLDSGVEERSRACSVSMRRADPNNGRWLFMVNCSGGTPHNVRIKLLPVRTNAIHVSRYDISVSCDCLDWIFGGADYNAAQGGYLETQVSKRRRLSDGSPPNVKDPNRTKKICKHVAAVFKYVRNYRLPNPYKGQTNERGTGKRVEEGREDTPAESV